MKRKPTRRRTRRHDDQPFPPEERRWVWHAKTLLRLRDRLLAEADARLLAVAERIEPHGEHLADSATDEFDHDRALALLAREENALQEITAALHRIEHGGYGVCELSGQRIPAARLHAIPWCRYTLEVERELERRGEAAHPWLPSAASVREGSLSIPGTGRRVSDEAESEARAPGAVPLEETLKSIAVEPESEMAEEFPTGYTSLIVPTTPRRTLERARRARRRAALQERQSRTRKKPRARLKSRKQPRTRSKSRR